MFFIITAHPDTAEKAKVLTKFSKELHKEVADYDYDYQTHSKLVNIILEETLKNIKLDSTSDMNLPWEIELKEI